MNEIHVRGLEVAFGRNRVLRGVDAETGARTPDPRNPAYLCAALSWAKLRTADGFD